VLVAGEDDQTLAIGFQHAGRALIEYWERQGPDDSLFLPIVFLYRHALELALKVAIREAAARMRARGDHDPELLPVKLDKWLASTKAGHNLAVIGERLDRYLGTLPLPTLPQEAYELVQTFHHLDPKGDGFRYATVWDKQTKAYVRAPRPEATHVDVVTMGDHFDSVLSLLDGLMVVLDEYRELQATMRP
jgi:hypothetical protein